MWVNNSNYNFIWAEQLHISHVLPSVLILREIIVVISNVVARLFNVGNILGKVQSDIFNYFNFEYKSNLL